MEEIATKAERTRQFIIESTASIFNKKGYAGTSLSDLTNATGLTKGSIYGNFENKEDVALAVFDYNYAKVASMVSKHMESATTFKEKLLVYADVYYHYSQSLFPEGGCPILNTAVEADDTNERLKDKAATAVTSWRQKVEELIVCGIEAGEFRKETNAVQLSTGIVALVEGGIMIAKVTDDRMALKHALDTVALLIDQMIGSHK